MGEEGRLPSPPRSVSGQKKELLLAKWTAPSVLFSWWYRSFIGDCVFRKNMSNKSSSSLAKHPLLHSPVTKQSRIKSQRSVTH